MKYLLDYGHGGNDPGAIGIDNLKEKDIVKEIGKRVKYHLERHQQTVIESRPNDETVSLTERSNKANTNNVDLCISIHCNAFSVSSAQGVEIFYYQGSTRGQQLANSILKEIVQRPRPPYDLQMIHLESFSYVSSHTLITFCVWAVVIYYVYKLNFPMKKLIAVLGLAWSVLIGFSRCWLGVHNPSDVIGAYLLGLLLFSIFLKIKERE